MNYQEFQRFSSLRWVSLIVVAIAAFIWYSTYQQLLLGQPIGNRPAPDWMMLIFWLAFGLALPIVFLWGGMKTEVRANGIHLQALPVPFCRKQIDYSDIATYEARQYRPLQEFGGWGIRFGLTGRAYTVSGNQGVQLIFNNGKRLLIGSSHPEQLVEAIDANMASN